MAKNDGNEHLYPLDMHLWRLQQDVLMEWGTFCIFTHQKYNENMQERGSIRFFVPVDASHRYEIVKYLEAELKKLRQEAVTIGAHDYDHLIDGMDLTVHTFMGLAPYMDEKTVDALATQAYQYLMALAKRKAREQHVNEDPNILQPIYAALRAAIQHVDWKYFGGDTPMLFSQRDPEALRANLQTAFDVVEALRADELADWEKRKDADNKL